MRIDENKYILDVCCGGKHFWFDQNQENTIFMDIRTAPKGIIEQQPNWNCTPDIVASFTDIPFDDETFHLVVFDPPHVVTDGNGIITTKYGKLTKEWEQELVAGFKECMRVLKPQGVLQFKFNDVSININDLLGLFPNKPLFGTKTKKGTNNTFWFTYMKGVS